MGIFAQRSAAVNPAPAIRNPAELAASIAAHLANNCGLFPVISPGLVAVTIDGRRVNVTVAEDDFPTPARGWASVWRKGADGERERAER